MKNHLTPLVCLTAFLLSASLCLPAGAATDWKDRLASLQEDQLAAKQAKADDIGHKIQVLQSQLEQEQGQDQKQREKIFKDFSDGVELEKKDLKDRISALDDRQKLFEAELEKKRTQDQIRLNEKQEEIKRLSLEMERLRAELVEDRAVLDKRIAEMKNQPAEAPEESATPLQNRTIKITEGKASEFLNEGKFNFNTVRPEYYLEIGDVVDVEVWRVPDLTRSVVVRPDGRISMPLVGDIDVVGMTLVDLRKMLTKKFSEYVLNPQVSIAVRQFGGRKFIILGTIRSPGVFRYQQDITLIEAIALAGGFSEDSKRGKVLIIRGDIKKDPQVKIISANMENVLQRGMLSENLMIMPNDIIYVGRDFLGDYKDVIQNLVAPSLTEAIDFFVLRSAIRTAQDKRN